MTQTSGSEASQAPIIDPEHHIVSVTFRDIPIATSSGARRVTQQGLPTTYYIPPEDVRIDYLVASPEIANCPWRGVFRYYHVDIGQEGVNHAAWSYPEIHKDYDAIKHYIAFDADKMDAIHVDANSGEMDPVPDTVE